MSNDLEYPGEEALFHIKTMYPGLWEKFGGSAKTSLKNHINNTFNAKLKESQAEKDALLRDCLPLIESVTFQGIGAELARRIRESLG